MKSEVIQTLVDKAKSLPAQGEYWTIFIAELENTEFDDNGKFGQGAPGSLQRWISIEAGPLQNDPVNLKKVYQQWESDYKHAEAQRIKQRYLGSTVEVQYFSKSGSPGKPERIPKDEADKPWKDGCILQEESAKIEGHGFDRDFGPTFTLRSTSIGTETPIGTVVAKRKLGGKIQYLIKPRSRPAEAKYQARRELEDLESKLRVNLDMYSPEGLQKTRERIEYLKRKV